MDALALTIPPAGLRPALPSTGLGLLLKDPAIRLEVPMAALYLPQCTEANAQEPGDAAAALPAETQNSPQRPRDRKPHPHCPVSQQGPPLSQRQKQEHNRRQAPELHTRPHGHPLRGIHV